MHCYCVVLILTDFCDSGVSSCTNSVVETKVLVRLPDSCLLGNLTTIVCTQILASDCCDTE